MSRKKKKKSTPLKTARARTDSGNLLLFPLLFILTVVPLIVYLKVIPVKGAALEIWLSEFNWDFFSYYKAVFLLIATAAATVIFFLHRRRLAIKKSAIYYPMAVYALLILLASVFSEYKGTAFYGFPDRYEGALVLLAYLTIGFLALNFVQNEKHIRLILGCLFVSAGLIGVLGIFQFFGLDLLRSEAGRALILPVGFRHLAEELSLVFEKHTIYATLYNPNYVGSYMAMLLPLSVAVFYYARPKKQIYASFVFSCLMFAVLIGCNSRAGIVGVSLAFLLLLFFQHRIIIANWKRSISLVLGFVLIIFVLNAVSGGRTLRTLASIVPAASGVEPVEGLELRDIVPGKKELQFIFADDKLVFNCTDGLVEVENAAGKALTYHFDEEEELLMFNEEPFQACGFMVWEEENILGVGVEGKKIYFTIDREGFKDINHRWEAVALEHAEAWGFAGRERLGSGRGYIWSRSLPLLKNTLFLGYGPDTFPFYFPQNDFFAKMIFLGNPYDLVDKPHNLYLQTALNTGLLSLAAMLVMFGLYLFASVRLYYQYRSDFYNFYYLTGFAVFLSVAGYLVAGLFNDSLVSVAPVFWVLFGVGVALNHLLLKESRG